MKNTKLFQTIRNLSERELIDFQNFIKSPYFNERDDVVGLVEILIRPIDKKVYMDKESAFKLLYPEAEYDDTIMRLLISETFFLLDKFLAYEEFRNSEILERIFSIKAYRHRMIGKSFELKFSSLKKKLQSVPKKDSNYLWYQYLLESEQNMYLQQLEIRGEEPNLQLVMDSLDHIYIARKLKYMCHMINYKNVTSTPYNIELQDPILDLVENSEMKEVPAIGTYYYLYQALVNFQNERLFSKAMDLIKSNLKCFTKEEKRQLLLFCVNYCIKKVNSGIQSYERLMLNLFKELASRNIILENGHMSPWVYKNIASVALRLGETQWTLHFLKKYRNHIDPKFKDNAYIYNLAKVHFNEGSFVKVIETLRAVEFNDLFYALDVRAILLKTYFELDEFVVMNSLASSFRQFVRRQTKLSTTHKQNYLNLISFTQRLAKLCKSNDIKSLLKLQRQLGKTEDISDRKWLKSKIKEIKHSFIIRA